MNIQTVLTSLAKKRPIFHNEADFQHALAWELREHCDCQIRLERRMDIDEKRRTYLDILAVIGDRKVAIELKYKMRAFNCTIEDEPFSLLNQGAQDNGRYDVLKDMQRLEQMVNKGLVDEGYLIFLTNDSSYYADPRMEKFTADQAFRIHEGREIQGILPWSDTTGEGTMKGREEPIVIEGTYSMKWQQYSQIDNSAQGEIKCLLVPIRSAGINHLLRSIDYIPVSQFDFRDRLLEQLKANGYHAQINREFGRDKVDIWAEKQQEQVAIEVRYKTAALQTLYNETSVSLKNQAAQDISRYDFLKDIEKLENIMSSRPGATGYAVIITNDRTYWEKPTKAASVDQDFRIHQGRTLQGEMSWKNASSGTMHNREESIQIKGQYVLDWKSFVTLGPAKNETFKMLVVEVGADMQYMDDALKIQM